MNVPKDLYVFEKRGQYIQSVNPIPFRFNINWTPYKWDAATVKDRKIAKDIANKTECRLMRFNPVTGILRCG